MVSFSYLLRSILYYNLEHSRICYNAEQLLAQETETLPYVTLEYQECSLCHLYITFSNPSSTTDDHRSTMDTNQRTSGALLGKHTPCSEISFPLSLIAARIQSCNVFSSANKAMSHLDRAGADIAQLLRRFENIIAYTPVRIALIFVFIIAVFQAVLVNVWFGLGWACLGGGILSVVLGV